MAEIYRIGVAIGMQDNATAVLQSLSKSLIGLNLKVADVEKGLNRVKVAALGLGAVFAGRELIHGFAALATSGAKLQAAQLAMTNAGMSHLEVVRETARAYQSMSEVKGPDITERINAIRELRGIVGAGAGGHDYREVNALLPNYLKVRELVGDKGGNDVFRAVEQQGGARYKADGSFDEPRFDKYVDAALRMLQAGGGNIKPRDLLNVMQMASTTARGMDPNAFWNMMMTPMLEMGGHRAGTALTALSRAFYGGIMPDRNARELERLGVFAGGQHIKTLPHMSREQRAEFKQQGYTIGRGGVVTVARGATRGEKELNDPNQGFYPWLRDVLSPLLRRDYQKNVASKPGNTESFDAYIRDEMYKALPTETARRMGALIISQLTSVKRDGTMRVQAPGLGAYDTAQQGFDKQLENVQRSWKSLMETLGLPAARDGASILKAVAAGLDSVTQWAAKHPTAARDLERFALGVGAVAVVSGSAAIAGVALGPLGSGIKLLAGGLMAFGPGGAAATALTTISGVGAGSLLAFAGGITALGAALVGLPPILKWAMGVPDSVANHTTSAKGVGYSGAHAPASGKTPQQAMQSYLDTLWEQMAHPQSGGRARGGGATVQHEAYAGGTHMQPIQVTFMVGSDVIGRHAADYMTRQASRPSPYGNSPDAMEVAPRPGQPLVSF
ncbi:MAG: hypothetical protein ACRYHQ_35250 [Janthinobacterium lividum]